MRSRNVVVVAALMVTGCLGSGEDPQVSSTTQGITATNKIGLNKIGLNKIGLNKIGLNKIGLNKIGLNKIGLNTLAAHDLINNPDGRDVLDFLVSCAFPAGASLVGTADDGVEYTFQGSIGLAPKWETRRLNEKEKRWISACMLARVNNSGASLLISLRGPNNALAVTAEEAIDYTLEEGAFYGDIFSDPQEFYACRGADLFSGDFGPSFELRSCAKPGDDGLTVCGMRYAGDCGAFAVERACERQVGDFYERCHTSPTQNGRFCNEGHATRFEEAVTVYVKEI